MTDKALVERLRKRTCVVFNSPGVHPDTECHEAADRIEALTAENERLREAMENAVQEIDEGWSLNARDILEAALGETK